MTGSPDGSAPAGHRGGVAVLGSRAMRVLHQRVSNLPLRTRLLVVLLGLLALICVIISVVVSVGLRHFLVGQLDAQLAQAGNRAARAVPPGAEPDTGRPPRPRVPQSLGSQPPLTLIAWFVDGQLVRGAVVSANGETRAIPAPEVRVLGDLPVNARPYSRALGALGSYRLTAAPDRSGGVIVTGLPLSGVEETLTSLAITEALVAGAALLLLGIAGALIVRRTLRPLHRVAATASRVSELTLDSGDVALGVRVPAADTNPTTEVGQVGAALNRMLGHVGAALAARQASETRVRQFVADASHELRTPLAAIRGYAELIRRVNGAVPPDVAHAMGRVESEAARMTVLVEDLLLLARLDSGRPLARESVELSGMLVDAVSDARIAGPDHRWQLELPEAPVTIVADGARVHQILANLLANARVHTPAGTTVRASLAVDVAGEATVRVADDGPGIPPTLLPEVFDRFARADSSRSRAAGGTGLGLAIVAAVVQAHHGSVAVDSAPGRTLFTVRLPATPDRGRAVP